MCWVWASVLDSLRSCLLNFHIYFHVNDHLDGYKILGLKLFFLWWTQIIIPVILKLCMTDEQQDVIPLYKSACVFIRYGEPTDRQYQTGPQVPFNFEWVIISDWILTKSGVLVYEPLPNIILLKVSLIRDATTYSYMHVYVWIE